MLPAAGSGVGAVSVIGAPVPLTGETDDMGVQPAGSPRVVVDWSVYCLPGELGKVNDGPLAVGVIAVTARVEAGLKGLVPAVSSAPLVTPSPSSSRASQAGSLICASVTA